MESDRVEKILLQGHDSVLNILRGLSANDLLLIELIRSGQYRPEALAAVAQSVRSGLYILDGLGDSLLRVLPPNLHS